MSKELYFDNEWIVRENVEFDEKMPYIAQDIVDIGINYRQLDEEETADGAVVEAMITVVADHLDSFCEMTNDEIESCLQKLVVACEFIVIQKELDHKK